MAEAEAEHVLGDWNGFEFKMVTPADHPKILDHARNVFCKSETSMSLVGYTEGLGDDFCRYVDHVLKKEDGLSFYAEHKESKKVAGVRVTYKACKSDARLPPHLSPQSLECQNIYPNVLALSESPNIYEHYGVEVIAELLLTSVVPEFRRQGLVTEIYRRSLSLLRAKGYPVAKSFFTSPHTRSVATKFGFEELNRKYFRDYVDINGKPFLLHAGEDEFGATLAIKF